MIIDYDEIISNLEARKVQIDACIDALQQVRLSENGQLSPGATSKPDAAPKPPKPLRAVGGVNVRLNQNPPRLNQNPESSCVRNAARGHSRAHRPAVLTFAITTAPALRNPQSRLSRQNQTGTPKAASLARNAARDSLMPGPWGSTKPACTSGGTPRQDPNWRAYEN